MEMYAKWMPKSKPKFALKTCKAYIYQVVHSIQENNKTRNTMTIRKQEKKQRGNKKTKKKHEESRNTKKNQEDLKKQKERKKNQEKMLN